MNSNVKPPKDHKPGKGGLHQSVASVFGEIVWLMSQADDFKDMTLSQLEVAVMSPVLLRQFRLFRENNMPVGLATWASVSAATKEKILKDRSSMVPKDWNSGDEKMVIDIVSPFGAREAIEKEIKEYLGL